MSNKSLTIVLPVYNGESRLTQCAGEILELASELTSQFSILVVDDGSTDDTSAVARELSNRFPQITLLRHRHRQGLSPIIDMVRRRVTSDVVIVHDGVTPIDTTQVRRLWQQSIEGQEAQCVVSTNDLTELKSVRPTHEAMAKVHERVLGFHLLQSANEQEVSAPVTTPTTLHRPSDPQPSDRTGVGQIPPLPRPNFLSTVADFALGE